MSVVCINSTVPVRRRMRSDGVISPLHHWGYAPRSSDAPLAHRVNRVEITLRAKLGGLDPNVLLATWWRLARGATGVYAVTQPDIWQALPLLRRLFPNRRFVTWAWMDWEVDRHLTALRACDHVLCLTPGAKRRLDAAGMNERASLAIWGCAPEHYRRNEEVRADTDVFIAGLTSRDTRLLAEGIALRRQTVLLAETTRTALGFPENCGEHVSAVNIRTETALIAAYRRCRVTWIPLRHNDPYPSGYTNLIESLLCGTAVVMGDTSPIPSEVLSLPGVFRYRTGSLEDFMRRTDEALAFMRDPAARGTIGEAAAKMLNGAALARMIREQLGVERLPEESCAS